MEKVSTQPTVLPFGGQRHRSCELSRDDRRLHRHRSLKNPSTALSLLDLRHGTRSRRSQSIKIVDIIQSQREDSTHLLLPLMNATFEVFLKLGGVHKVG